MTFEDLGYTKDLENYRKENNLNIFGIGRVISEQKERYIVKTDNKEYEAEVIGNIRYTAKNRLDFPAVGDWVAISEYDFDKVLIHEIFPRKTIIERQAVGRYAEKQIIATNVDHAFLVQSVDRDFNINRLERYITICEKAGVQYFIVLSKIDLIDTIQLNEIVNEIQNRINNIPIISISNETKQGYDKLNHCIIKGKTYCLLGSSGVGKSSLINNISGEELMKTGSISLSTSKGRHITSNRHLFILKNGGIFIDNPGMREVGIADAQNGLEKAFDDIFDYSQQCKFKDCTHTHESGCAVIEAVNRNDIDKSSYKNFLKMQREQLHFEQSKAERRRKDKEFGKMVKEFKKEKKNKS